MTLYINQEPLKEKKVPIYCRLFSECDRKEDFMVFKSTVEKAPNIQELNTYLDLTNNMMSYFVQLKNDLGHLIEDKNAEDDIGEDILKKELISITCEILF